MSLDAMYKNSIIDAYYDGFIVNVKVLAISEDIECACYLYESNKVILKSGYKNNKDHHFYIKNKKADNLMVKVFFRDKKDPSIKISCMYNVAESKEIRYDFSKDNPENGICFIGVTRFSLYNPESRGWRLSATDEKEYLDILYSDRRLKVRFDIFINKALPLYEKMRKNFSYKHIIQYSSYMPEEWKIKLKRAASQYDFLILIEYSQTIRPLPIPELLDGYSSQTLIYFRVDDDDLLSVNYLDALSKYGRSEYEGMIVSFGKGVIAKYHDGKFVEFRDCHRRFLGLGMAMIGRYDALKGNYWIPRSGNHEKVDTKSPTIVDSRNHMFVWTQHVTQDTRVGRKNPIEFTNKLMNNYSPVTEIKNLKSYFPTLTNELDKYMS